VTLMIKHIFDSMNEALNEIKSEFPHAFGPKKDELLTQLNVLRSMSDTFIEEWLCFEEKLGVIKKSLHEAEKSDTDELSFVGAGEIDDWMEAYRRGQGYFQLLMFPQAVEAFEHVTQKEPDFIMGRLYLALGYLNKGQWDESRRQLQLVLGTASHHRMKAVAHNAMGCILAKEKLLEAALEHFEEANKLDGDFHDSMFNQAVCLFNKEMYEDAAERCRKYLSEKDNDWECMILLAYCYEHLDVMEKALSWRQVAVKVSGNVRVTLNLAHFYERTMEFKKAVETFEKVLVDQPDCALAYHGLGWCRWMLGEKEKGVALIKKGLTLSPNHVSFLFSLAWIHLQEEEWDEAESILYKILEIRPDHTMALAALSRLNSALGYYEDAKDVANRLITMPQGESIGLGCYQMGCVFMEEGCLSEAIAYFDEAIEKGTAVKESKFYKGLCHYLMDNREYAEQSWKDLKMKNKLPLN
jgi:tetratricopeptide (TPR) repeat protein